jgi:hypothetical protein
MENFIWLTTFCLTISLAARSQDSTAREKAYYLAREEFSKSKYMKKEKYGVVKELNRVIESTPFITEDFSQYSGTYIEPSLRYRLKIAKDAQDKIVATLSIPGSKDIMLKDVSIQDAYFQATKQTQDSTEFWEGAFISKNDNGTIDFGLGILLKNPVSRQGLNMTRLFFMKANH